MSVDGCGWSVAERGVVSGGALGIAGYCVRFVGERARVRVGREGWEDYCQ